MKQRHLDGKALSVLALRALLFALTFLSLLYLPGRLQDVTLDSSWQAAISYFAVHRKQAGVDFVFTYGPLGFLQTEHFQRELFPCRFLFELVYRAFLVYLIERLFTLGRVSVVRRIGFYTVFFLLVNISVWPHVVKTDVASFLFLALLILCAFLEGSAPLWRNILAMVLLAILSLGKGNLAPIAFIVVVFATVRHCQAGRRLRSSPIVCFLAASVGFWLLAGQKLANFPAYARGIWEIGSGYNDSMSVPLSQANAWLAVFSIVALIAMLPILYGILSRLQVSPAPSKANRLAVVVLVWLIYGTVYKTSFTRADGHTVIFINFTVVLLLLLGAMMPRPAQKWQWGIVADMAGLGLVTGFALSSTVSSELLEQPPVLATLRCIIAPIAYERELERGESELRARFDFPNFRQVVREGTVDIWPSSQDLLVLSGVNYSPRPVFQGYSAYNRYTSGLNASYLNSRAAPDFLFFAFAPIDTRFAFEEDNEALPIVLRSYHPISVPTTGSVEPQFLLMHRVSQPSPESVTVQTHSFPNVSFVEGIAIPEPTRPENWLRLRIHVHRTLMGRLITAIRGTSPLHLLATDEQGRRKHGRLVIDNAEQGFLIRPCLENNIDVSTVYAGKLPEKRIRRIQIIDPSLGQSYDGTADFTLEEITPAIAPP